MPAAMSIGITRNLSPEKILHRRRGAFVRHVRQLDARVLCEQFHRKVMRAARPWRSIGDLAGLLLRGVDQLLHGAHVQCGRIHRDREHESPRQRDRREVIRGIVRQLLEQAGVERVGAEIAQEDGVAVGRRTLHVLGTDDRRAAGAVVDHDRLPERFAHLGTYGARKEIGTAPRGKRHDQANRLRRIALPGGRQCNDPQAEDRSGGEAKTSQAHELPPCAGWQTIQRRHGAMRRPSKRTCCPIVPSTCRHFRRSGATAS